MQEDRETGRRAESEAAPRSAAGASEAESTPPPGSDAPATKEQLGTDLSEISRARLSDSDKTINPESRTAHAAELADTAAGTDADDDTAAAVEGSPTATVDRSHPGPITRTEGGPETPTPAPAPQAPTSGEKQFAGGGSTSAPRGTVPSGTGTPTVPPADARPSADAPAGAAPSGPTPNQPGAAARPPGTAGGPARPAGGPAARPAGAARPDGAGGARPAAAGAGAKPGAAAKPAAPPKPAEPDPDDVVALRAIVPDLTWERKHGYVEVKIPRDQLLPVARKVKALGYDYLSAVTGVDWRDRLEMLYHLYSYDYVEHPGCIVLRLDLPPDPNPLCPSLTAIWPGAEFQEREVYDLMGVKFVGHPDLRRILTEDRFPGHPLRKDWSFDWEYVLVHHLRYGAEGQAAPPGGEEGYRRV